MRKRDPNHEKRLAGVRALPLSEAKRQIALTDYRLPDFVPSEILATLVRVRQPGLVEAAAEALHRRVVARATARVLRVDTWREAAENDSETIRDAVDHFWEKFLEDRQAVCNAEVRFEVYLKNRVDDYMRSKFTMKNSQPSVDASPIIDDDGNITSVASQLEDPNGASPEDILLADELSAAVFSSLMRMPRDERNAYVFRIMQEFDWAKTAALLKCSVPTARELLNRCLKKLQGVVA